MVFFRFSKSLFVVLSLCLLFVSDSFAEGNCLNKLLKKKAKVVAVVADTVDTTHVTNEPFDFCLAVSPEIPDEMSFCGKTVDLRRTDMRERLDRELMSMMYMQSSSLLLLKRANRYFPVIEPILKANDLPDDLKYLACIESGLNPMAMSPSKAVGMWQFMQATAVEYGLEVNDDVDERYHVKKETEAACKYFKSAYSKYHDWVNTVASYNAGMGRISNELENQGENSAFNLWLVEETKRYVFRILACKEFLENPKKYGFYLKRDQFYMPYVCKDTVVTGSVPNWVRFARDQGISFYDLKTCNLWIRNDSLQNVGGKAYEVAIPLKESLYFDKNKVTVHRKNWAIDEK